MSKPVPAFAALEDGEVVVEDTDELLWRQVGKHLWDDQHNKPGLDSFGPQAHDERRPSLARSSRVSAQESRDWHSENVSKSLGVWACSVGEVIDAGSRCVDDSGTPIPDGKMRAPGHVYVEFRHLVERPRRYELMAKLLKHALKRGEIPTDDNH